MRNLYIFALLALSVVSMSQQSVILHWQPVDTWQADSIVQRYISLGSAEYDNNGIPAFVKKLNSNSPELSDFIFAPIGNEENELLQQSEIILPDTVQWSVFERTTRRQTQAFLKVNPFVLQNGKILKLQSFDIKESKTKEIKLSMKKTLSIASNSVLNSGKWTKIQVSSTGIYKLTAKDLRSIGATPANVRIFGYGGKMLPEDFSDTFYDDLPELAIWRENDYVLFYAQGPIGWNYNTKSKKFEHTRNPYSDAGYYFVTSDVGVGKTIDMDTLLTDAAVEVNSFCERICHEKELVMLQESGRTFYGEDFGAGTNRVFSFDVPNMLSKTSYLTLNMASTSTTSNSYFSFSLGGQMFSDSILKVSSTKESPKVADSKTILKTFTPSASNSISLTINCTSSNAKSYLNYFELNIKRALSMTGDVMFFRDNAYATSYDKCKVKYSLSNASNKIKIWNITVPDRVTQMPTTLSGSTMTFVGMSYPLQEYVAVNPSADFPSPVMIGQVKNQNLHALPSCDMAIITNSDFLAQAKQLAEAHQNISGLIVHVVTDQQVYNEFSSGTPDATAYRRFMKMFYDRAVNQEEMPRYLLLFGDGHYDNRRIIHKNESNHKLLTYQSVNSIYEMSSYVTDDYFALLDDSEGKIVTSENMDIGVGRFPAGTVKEAQIMVDKTIKYMENTYKGAWKTKFCFLADDGNNNEHMVDADSAVYYLTLNEKKYSVKKIYLDAYKQETTASGESYPLARKNFLDAVKSGVLVVNYTGHGSPLNWANEGIFVFNDAKDMYNDALGFWMAFTCNFSRFDAETQSGGEALLTNPKGGAVATFSAARTVYSSNNDNLNKTISKLFFQKENGEHLRLGDIIRKAKNRLGNEVNKRAFCLLGDPALMLNFPDQYTVKVEKINGNSILGSDTIHALSEITLGGSIVDDNADIVSDFNGYIHITLYDKEQNVKTLANDAGSIPFQYKDRTNILFSGKTKVINGRYEINFRVPKDIQYFYGTGMILGYAADETNSYDACGYFDDFYIGGESFDYMPENQGPNIELYLNAPSFRSGDKVNETPLLVAHVEDESGINAVGNGIGHDIIFRLNNDPLSEVILNDYYEAEFGNYKKGTITYKMPKMENGIYSLFFRVWDLQNNSSTVTVQFQVKEGLKPIVTSMRCYPNPTSDVVYFVYEHNRPDEQLTIVASVYDINGSLLWQATQTIVSESTLTPPLKWNLKNQNGNSVPNGIYIVRMAVGVGNGDAEILSSKVIVKK